MVNPYDIEETAEKINEALKMEPAEKKKRMAALREIVRKNDVYKWCSTFLAHFEQLKKTNNEKT